MINTIYGTYNCAGRIEDGTRTFAQKLLMTFLVHNRLANCWKKERERIRRLCDLEYVLIGN